MLECVAAIIRDIPDDGPLYLVGSSMGALVALHFRDRYRHTPEGQRVRKLVLLAPGFDFMDNRDRTIGEHWREKWEAQGTWPFYNYAQGREVPVHYGLIKDLAHYDSYAVTVDIPILIYHGTEDTVVHPDQSHRFVEIYTSNVTLHWVDSDHELLNATQQILEGMSAFFDIDLLPNSPDVSVREER
jgi:alpha-beta hydrolase superfamily lysophospholipase